MANSVIERGYEIYDEWNISKYNSRKIVSSVRFTMANMYAKQSYKARIEALACLFALDMRVKERYSDIIRCFISYFAWRREAALLKWMRGQFDISNSHDVRDIIEIEIRKIRENIDINKADITDKKAQGGKIVGIEGENYTVDKGEPKEDAPEENTLYEHIDADEEIDETIDAIIKESIDGKDIEIKEEKRENQLDVTETVNKKGESVASNEFSESQKEQKHNNKIENNGFIEESKPNTDKIKENNSYNYAIDEVPIYKETEQINGAQDNSFIDEVIIDNIIKGKADVIGHNPISDVKQDVIVDKAIETNAPTIENGKRDKDAYLYDKMIADIKGDSLREKMPVTNSNVTTNADKKSEENRLQIKVDESISMENELRRSINDKFTEKMIAIHKSLMENALREELIIASEEFLIDAPVRIIGESNAQEYNLSGSVLGRK